MQKNRRGRVSKLCVEPSRELPLVRVQQGRAEVNGLPRARGKRYRKYLRRGKEPRQQNPAYVGMREWIGDAKA